MSNQTREDSLRDALDHIAKVASNSRTRTKRLSFIEKRAVDAIEGVPYDCDSFVLPIMETKSPAQFDYEIRGLKRELTQYKNMTFFQRIVWAFKGSKHDIHEQ